MPVLELHLLNGLQRGGLGKIVCDSSAGRGVGGRYPRSDHWASQPGLGLSRDGAIVIVGWLLGFPSKILSGNIFEE